jgi:hypothetical protein
MYEIPAGEAREKTNGHHSALRKKFVTDIALNIMTRPFLAHSILCRGSFSRLCPKKVLMTDILQKVRTGDFRERVVPIGIQKVRPLHNDHEFLKRIKNVIFSSRRQRVNTTIHDSPADFRPVSPSCTIRPEYPLQKANLPDLCGQCPI